MRKRFRRTLSRDPSLIDPSELLTQAESVRIIAALIAPDGERRATRSMIRNRMKYAVEALGTLVPINGKFHSGGVCAWARDQRWLGRFHAFPGWRGASSG